MENTMEIPKYMKIDLLYSSTVPLLEYMAKAVSSVC